MENIVQEFIYQNCVMAPHLFEYREKLYNQFAEWCMEKFHTVSFAPVHGKKDFDVIMEKFNFSKVREYARGPFVYQGLKLGKGVDRNKIKPMNTKAGGQIT